MTVLTPYRIGQIHMLRRLGKPIASIAARMRVCRNTVRKALRLADEVAAVAPRRRRRTAARVALRRRLVLAIARERVTRNGKCYPRFCSAAAIKNELHRRHRLSVSKATVYRDLHAMGMSCRVRKTVPCIDPVVIARRNQFAHRMLRTVDDFSQFVFTDETIISSNDFTDRTMWVSSPDDVLPRERMRTQNCYSVQVWGAIMVGQRIPLVLFPRKDHDEDGKEKGWRLNAPRYIRRCLSKLVPHMRGKVLVQDGARSHTSKKVKEYLGRKKVEYIEDWPAYSPDLNPIEQMWSIMKREVAKYHPQSQQELERAVVEVWAAQSQELMDKLVFSFEEKLKACAHRRGKY